MSKSSRSNITQLIGRGKNFWMPRLLGFMLILTFVPAARVSFAYHPTLPDAASPQPDGSPTPAPTPTPTEEELRLQQEKQILDLQKDIEIDKKAIRDAQPQPVATPLAGDTTLDEGVRMESDIVSYAAMSEAAVTIVGDIGTKLTNAAGPKPITNLAIYDAQTIKDWRFYKAIFPAFRGQVADILTSYKNVLCAPGAGVDPNFYNEYCRKSTGVAFSAIERVDTAALSGTAIQSAFAVGGSVIKSFIDLAALFRTDTKITGKSLTIDESALVAEIFRELKNKRPGTNLYYPKIFPQRVNPDGESETIRQVGFLFIYKFEADRLIKNDAAANEALAGGIKAQLKEKTQVDSDLAQVKVLKQELSNLYAALQAERIRPFRQKLWEQIVETQASLSKLKSQVTLEARLLYLKGVIGPVQAEIDANDASIKQLNELNGRFQTFVDQFVKLDASGNNALGLFIKAEDVDQAMPDNDSYWLEIKSVAAGGNNRVRKNLIWYFTGARVDHSGGVIIEYTLYDRTGAVVASDQLSHYKGYIEPKKIRRGNF